MRAVYAATINSGDPLAGLRVGEVAAPEPPSDWVPVQVKAAALNHHDLWALRGVGLKQDQLPMILGTDAAGIDDQGHEVIVHGVIGDPGIHGDETLDPHRTLLSERYPGALADTVYVPRRNLIPKPAGLSFVEAACLPTSWLTAYRMLMIRGRMSTDCAVLIQGAGGGVSTAAALLALAHGARTYVTSRDARKRERMTEFGALALEPGAKLPERVDIVVETVGEATLEHSFKACKPGGRIVISGATSGNLPTIDLRRLYFLQLQVLGSTMGTAAELRSLIKFLMTSGLRPIVDSTYTFDDAPHAFERLLAGQIFGKIVLTH